MSQHRLALGAPGNRRDPLMFAELSGENLPAVAWVNRVATCWYAAEEIVRGLVATSLLSTALASP